MAIFRRSVPHALIGNMGLYGNYGGGGTNPVTLSPAVAGGMSLRGACFSSPLALQPDNQAHQFYIGGNYRLQRGDARNISKLPIRTQPGRRTSGSMGLAGAPAGVANLGGKRHHPVQAGITSRPVEKVNLLANVRYESRDNPTPVALYNCDGNPCNAAGGHRVSVDQ